MAKRIYRKLRIGIDANLLKLRVSVAQSTTGAEGGASKGGRAVCSIFSAQKPEAYTSQTRSIRLGGHATSIRLEATFWVILEEIAAKQNVSVPLFLTKLYDEILDHSGHVANFASLLRCACITYTATVKGREAAEAELERVARRDFGPQLSTCNDIDHGAVKPWMIDFCEFVASPQADTLRKAS